MVNNMSRKRLDWNKYTWEDFENICFRYATRKYDTSVYKVILTERRKDKGRDIVITNKKTNEISWAECKHHKRSVDLSDIGKNVVLAITNQINKIIFFSVSSITPNTKHEILTTAKTYGFDVLFLDGINLDDKIAEDKNILNTYFKDSFYCFYPNKDLLSIDICVDEFPNAYNDSFYDNLGYRKLQKGLEFYIHIFVKNNNDVSDITDVKLNIDESPDCHLFSYINNIELIKSQCDDLITIRGILLNTQAVISLPQLQISYRAKEKQYNKSFELGEIDGTECWFVPLCGHDYLSCISKAAIMAEKVNQGYTKILFIRGASGSGKSRLLKEIMEKMYQYGFQTVYVNAMQNTNIIFFKELIRQLLYLPHLNSHNMFSLKEFNILLKNCGIVFSQPKLIYQYLWYNQSISSTLMGEFIVQCIICKKRLPKLHIQIDNIQCLDKYVEEILLYVCSVCSNIKTHVFFAFSLNTSILRQSDNRSFIKFLENEAMHEENGFVELHQIHKLDKNAKVHIAEQCLKLSSNDYNKELTEIARSSGNLPLDIILLCKSIFDSGCMSYNNGNYVISNSELFSERIKSLSDSMSSLISVRLNSIDNCVISKGKKEKLFQLIIFFENKVSINLLQEFSINPDSVYELIQKLILSQQEDGFISFYHENYYRYLSQTENFNAFTKSELKLLLDYCRNNSSILNPSMLVNQAKCLYFLNEENEFQDFSEKTLEILKSAFCNNEIIRLSDFYIKVTSHPRYNNKRLLFSIEKALAKMETMSFVEGICEFQRIESQIKESRYSFDVATVCKFYHYYVNSYTHSGKYQKAIAILEEFEKLQDIPLQYKFLIEDRYCMCFFSVGSFSKANEHIDKAIKIARRMDSDFWISTAYSDKAFNYFYNTNQVSKIRYYFNKAIKYYNEENDQTPYRIIEIEIQTALSYILCDNEKKAKQHIDKAITYANERNYTYLLIPALNIKSYLFMRNNDMEGAIEILKKALFFCELFGSNKWMLIILNSLGIATSLSGDADKGYNYFTMAMQLLKSIQENETIVSRFYPLVVNYTLSGNKNGFELLLSKEDHNRIGDNGFIGTVYIELNKRQDDLSYPFITENYYPLTIKEYALMY